MIETELEKIISITAPEKRLWFAVLLQAFKDIVSPKKELREEALRWFQSDTSGICEICSILKIPTSYIHEKAFFFSQHRKESSQNIRVFAALLSKSDDEGENDEES
jgi:hypothetical protein